MTRPLLKSLTLQSSSPILDSFIKYLYPFLVKLTLLKDNMNCVQVSSGSEEGEAAADLSVVTTEPVWRAVITRTMEPRAAVQQGKMAVTPNLLKLAKFFTFFDFE